MTKKNNQQDEPLFDPSKPSPYQPFARTKEYAHDRIEGSLDDIASGKESLQQLPRPAVEILCREFAKSLSQELHRNEVMNKAGEECHKQNLKKQSTIEEMQKMQITIEKLDQDRYNRLVGGLKWIATAMIVSGLAHLVQTLST